jgi:hypothetical protein
MFAPMPWSRAFAFDRFHERRFDLKALFFQFLECSKGFGILMLFKKFDHVINMGMQEQKLVCGTGFTSLTLLQALLEPVPESVSLLRIINVPAQVTKNGSDIAFEINVEKA